MAVEDFQQAVQEATDLRRTVRSAEDPKEKELALKAFTNKKAEAEKFLQYGPSFEKAYREYIRVRQEYRAFNKSLSEVTRLEGLLSEPSFKSLAEDAPKDAELDDKAKARVELVMQETDKSQATAEENAAMLECLKLVYGEGNKEYNALKKYLESEKKEPAPQTKGELEKELGQAKQHVQELWANPMVRYFAGQAEVHKILDGYHSGQDVIETQSVVHNLNQLHDWEQQHRRTTIGGVLTGPPGVGKTTLIRHYLQEKDRDYVYIDLSEDITRYLLYGSKDIQFKSSAEHHEALVNKLGGLDEEGFRKFVTENADRMEKVFGLQGDEATIASLNLMQEKLSDGKEAGSDELLKIQKKVREMAGELYRRELATEFSHLVKRNGWRDGVVVAALRRGDSIIFDEFNKNKNWSLLYSLMTAKPGENWYFADNDENITIPDDWRMYFTANIGRKHGGFQVAEALASRAGGKVMETDYPPRKEEMLVGLSALANPDGFWMRSKEDLAKLYVLINEVFPATRQEVENQPQSVSVSYRTLRDTAEKLISTTDKDGNPVYRATDKSFDEAAFEVMVETQAALYEDKTVAKKIVDVGTSVGLFLNDELKDQVLKYISKEAYEERKKSHAKHEDFAAIVSKVRGLSKDVMADAAVPSARQF